MQYYSGIYDKRIDVFSFGLMMLVLLADGAYPAEYSAEKHPITLVLKVQKGLLPARTSNVQEPDYKLACSMMALDAANRPTLVAVVKALEALAGK